VAFIGLPQQYVPEHRQHHYQSCFLRMNMTAEGTEKLVAGKVGPEGEARTEGNPVEAGVG
jgi:hypothetical protein